MPRFIHVFIAFLMLAGLEVWAQTTPPAGQSNTITPEEATQLRQEIDQLKKTVNVLEQKLEAQSKPAVPSEHVTADLASNYAELGGNVLRRHCGFRLCLEFLFQHIDGFLELVDFLAKLGCFLRSDGVRLAGGRCGLRPYFQSSQHQECNEYMYETANGV